MSLVPDWQIEKAVKITPFEPEKRNNGNGSYGPSSFGYDFRWSGALIGEVTGSPFKLDELLIEPGEYYLLESMETVELDNTVTGLPYGKSTHARKGLLVNMTVIDAGFRGKLTIPVCNLSVNPIKLYPGDGICQIVFDKSPYPCKNQYAGLYQNAKQVEKAKC